MSDARTRSTRAQRLLVHGALLALCAPALLPLVFMVSTSLKSDAQIYRSGAHALLEVLASLWPRPIAWQNYPHALKTVPLGLYLRNTLVLCLANVVGA